jgi:hypothetical protein
MSPDTPRPERKRQLHRILRALRIPENGFDLQLRAASQTVLTTSICTKPLIGLSSDSSQAGVVPARLWHPLLESLGIPSIYKGPPSAAG